jgi:hypothetical protein
MCFGSLRSYSTTMLSSPDLSSIDTASLFDVSTMVKGAVAERAWRFIGWTDPLLGDSFALA